MAKKQDDPRGKQKGAQAHAEGQRGEKTHARFLEEVGSEGAGQRAADDRAADARSKGRHPQDGRHRLFEGREQRDEAERNSEKNRLDADIDVHGHVRENFQVRGGAESHPARPRSRTDPANPDAPNPSSGLRDDERPDRSR
jgi:hypothetical protein